jgi:hypothetical protein
MTASESLPAPLRPRSVFTIVLTLVGVAGIPATFLPFVWDVSPVKALLGRGAEGVGWIAAPFFLAPLVTLLLIRWIAAGPLSRRERVFAWVVGVAAAASASELFAEGLVRAIAGLDDAPSGSADWVTFGILALALPALVLAIRARRILPDTNAALMVMQAIYAANAIACLWVFSDARYQTGAYLSMVTSGAYVVQMVGAAVAGWRLRARSRAH